MTITSALITRFWNYWGNWEGRRGQLREWVNPWLENTQSQITVSALKRKPKDTHCTVRHSFRALFCSRHLNAIKKPDSLQQALKAGGRKKVAKRERTQEEGHAQLTWQCQTFFSTFSPSDDLIPENLHRWTKPQLKPSPWLYLAGQLQVKLIQKAQF